MIDAENVIPPRITNFVFLNRSKLNLLKSGRDGGQVVRMLAFHSDKVCILLKFTDVIL